MRVLDAIIAYLRLLIRVSVDAAGRQTFSLPRKYASRLSVLRRHVIPAFGELMIAALTRTMVREEAENLTIEWIDRHGRHLRRPAAHGQSLSFVRALGAVWRFVFPDVSAPFAGALVRQSEQDDDDDDDTSTLDVNNLAALQHQLSAAEGKGAMDHHQVERALVAAVYRDAELSSRPNLVGRMIANTAHLIVLLIATGARISEVARIRWSDINFEKGFIVILQSKRRKNKRGRKKPKFRIVPLQFSMLPWLSELQQEAGITELEGNRAFVIRSNPAAAPQTRAALNTLIKKVASALMVAGEKPVGKSTHWGRSTHASWGKHATNVNSEELKHFLGHQPFAGTTDDYVAMLIELLKPKHRKYIKLPTPDAVRAKLADFVPMPVDWRDGRTQQSRTNEAKARRRQTRLDQKAPPATLDGFILRLLS
jgi:integrase